VLLAVAVLPSGTPVFAQMPRGGGARVLSVPAARAWCGTYPRSTTVVSVHGYFAASYAALGEAPNVQGYSHVMGGLFATARIPRGSILRWSIDRRWKRFGAFFLRFANVFPPRTGIRESGWFTFHGLLHCQTYRMYVTSDPFPRNIPIPSAPPLIPPHR
jgi:hypothetical protein